MRRLLIAVLVVLCAIGAAPVALADECNECKPVEPPPKYPPVPTQSAGGVNSHSGNFHHERQDLVVPDRSFDLDFRFHYNSGNTALDQGLGPGWSFSYGTAYELVGSNVRIRHGDGYDELFTWNGSVFVPEFGTHSQLTQYQPGKFEFKPRDGTRYRFDDPSHRRLTSIIDRNGNTVSVYYTAGRPTLVVGPSGHSVTLRWLGGRLRSLGDADSLTPVLGTWYYEYDRYGRMIRAADPLGNAYVYHYGPMHQLTGVRDRAGNDFQVDYDLHGAAVSVITASGARYFEFDSTSCTTTVREVGGGQERVSVYAYDGYDRLALASGACCGGALTFGYDAGNNTSYVRNALLRATTYTYDARGNALSRVEANGNTTTWTYHPTYNLIATEQSPGGQVTSFIYDPSGNVIQVNEPGGVVLTYQYDGFGNLTRKVDGNGFQTLYSYDARGLMVQQSDAFGTKTFTYDGAGNRISATDELGRTTTYTYDLDHHLLTKTNPAGATWTSTYDGNGRLSSTTDPRGAATQYVRDAEGRVVQKITPAGTQTLVLDQRGNVVSESDALGNTTSFARDPTGRVTQETNPNGARRGYVFDAAGNLITSTNFRGDSTRYEYDARSRLIRTTNPLGGITMIAYDADGHVTSRTSPAGILEQWAYDARGRIVSHQTPVGTTSYTYDNNDNALTETDPNGHTTSQSYDGRNRKTSTLAASGALTQFQFDASDQRTGFINALSATTQYTFDAAGNMVSEQDALGQVTSYLYDAAGNPIRKTDPNGYFVEKDYDLAGRVIQVRDNGGVRQAATYDAAGRRSTLAGSNGETVTYQHSPAGEVIEVLDPQGRAIQRTFDADGNLVVEQDRLGGLTSRSYDALGRMTSLGEPNGASSQLGYDADGRVIGILDAAGRIMSLTYDAAGRLTRFQFPGGSTMSYEYDPVGNVTRIVEPSGSDVHYGYNAVNHLILKDYPGSADESYTYDALGRITGAMNSAATVSFGYDAANRKTSETLNGRVTTYVYGLSDLQIIYPSGRVIHELRDPADRVAEIRDGASWLVRYAYDSAGRIANRQYSNGTQANAQYNVSNAMLAIQHTGPGGTIAGFQYTFDSADNRSTAQNLANSTRSEVYSLDIAQRLVALSRGMLVGGSIPAPTTMTNIAYDLLGNRTQKVTNGSPTDYTVNNLNQYTLVNPGPVTPTYDLNGNLTSDGTHAMTYDLGNRLAQVSGSSSATYAYDALGRRVRKVVNGVVTNYAYDDKRIIEEYDGGGATIASYVYGAGLDEITVMIRGASRYFYHQDSKNNVMAVTSAAGSVVERYEYDGYGETKILDPTYGPRSSSVIGNRFMYSGREMDAETGFYYYRARHYDPVLGRFLQRDPLGPDAGLNLYEFVHGNPLNVGDPSGLDPTCPEKRLDCTRGRIQIEIKVAAPYELPFAPIKFSGELALRGEFELCNKCCPDCSIKQSGFKRADAILRVKASATAEYISKYVAAVEIYGYIGAGGGIRCEWDGCKGPQTRCCGTLMGTVSIGAKGQADFVYAGGEISGRCEVRFCIDPLEIIDGQCCPSGRLFFGWDLWLIKGEVSYVVYGKCIGF